MYIEQPGALTEKSGGFPGDSYKYTVMLRSKHINEMLKIPHLCANAAEIFLSV
jgi:hypothetical protein